MPRIGGEPKCNADFGVAGFGDDLGGADSNGGLADVCGGSGDCGSHKRIDYVLVGQRISSITKQYSGDRLY